MDEERTTNRGPLSEPMANALQDVRESSLVSLEVDFGTFNLFNSVLVDGELRLEMWQKVGIECGVETLSHLECFG